MILCWSVKGGSGTTVTACALALHDPSVSAVLVDLAGDVPVTLGMPAPSGPGVVEWINSPAADASALGQLAVAASESLAVIPRSAEPSRITSASVDIAAFTDDHWTRLGSALRAMPQRVVVDGGNGAPSPHLADHADQSLLVIRPCFVALRRAVQCGHQPTGVILINEPGRALRARDIEHALGVPIVAEFMTDPTVARAVDAGLLSTRVPRTLSSQLRGIAA